MRYSIANLKKLLKENEEIDPYKVDYHDPSTPSEHLAAVHAAAKGPGANVVLKGLAKNPNTPPHVLSDLLPDHEDAWQNPSLPLHVLEDPNFIHKALHNVTNFQLRAKSALHWISQNDPKASPRLAFHPDLEPEHVDAIFDNLPDKSKPNIYPNGLLTRKPATAEKAYERIKQLLPHQSKDLFLSKLLSQTLQNNSDIAKNNPSIVKDILINGFHAPPEAHYRWVKIWRAVYYPIYLC